ncbi:thioredoxin-like [Mercenaria mercenaria]|uniref:thioredoxin-like n=1 Tax=Mercenaria mercenaria TaxID=6596 RepID=UPI001E1D6987|nr:thioredoxin-like [Mercenaria mercenaria]
MVKMIATKAEWDAVMKDAGDKVVAVDFTASWCGPCKMIGPKFEAFSTEYTNIIFIKVDVDENDEVAQAEGISAMPTFKFYKNGKQVDELVGASEAKLKEMCEKHK